MYENDFAVCLNPPTPIPNECAMCVSILPLPSAWRCDAPAWHSIRAPRLRGPLAQTLFKERDQNKTMAK